MARTVKLTATAIAGYLDGDDLGEDLNEVFANIIEDMKESPGGDNEEVTLIIANDLEPEDEEEESDNNTEEKSSGT